MKDSGIPWIGQIPEYWEVEKAKNIFCLRTSKGNDVLEHLAATQTYGMYPQRLLEGVVQVAVNTDYTQFRTVHINDYVISLRSFQGGFEISEYEGVCSPAYQVFYSKIPICHNYYKVLFKSVSFIEFMNSLTVGIREGKNIQYSDFSVSSLPVPPLSEQETIAAHLDKKCGEIDELIEVEQQMISDLESYRQSVITEAVTHGLNPNAPLRDSGIPWIGQVPVHWKVAAIKQLCRDEKYSIKTGPFGSQLKGDDLKEDGDVRVYNQRNVIDNDFSKVSSFVSLQKANELDSFYTMPNDILVTSRGTIGKAAIMPENEIMGILHPCLIALRIHVKKASLRWIQRWINDSESFHKEIDSKSNATTINVIYTDTIRNIRIPIPPLSEQQEIADYLDAKCAEIDELIKVKQEKIETLKQYRQSLIFEAVTGKATIA